MIQINSEKAVAIAKEKIRAIREIKYAENDIRIQNALADEDVDLKSKAIAYRDYLRGLPDTCENKTAEQLTDIIANVMSYDAFVAKDES